MRRNSRKMGSRGGSSLGEIPDWVRFLWKMPESSERVRKESGRESKYMRSFVMKEQEAEDYRICEKNAEIEIRAGFNSNLVVQNYRERKKNSPEGMI